MPDINQNSERPVFAAFLLLSGGVMLMLISGASYLFLVIDLNLRDSPLFIGFLPLILIGIGAGVIFRLGQKCYVRGKKMLAVSGDQLMKTDNRPPVLYLRSFKDDSIAANPTNKVGRRNLGGLINELGTQTEEEVLANELRRIGPPIAVGEPEEELPKLGMARMQFSHKDWEAGVQDLMTKAKLVIMRAGDTPGTLKELEMAVKHIEPTRLVLLIPFQSDREAPVDADDLITLNLSDRPEPKDGAYFRYKDKADKILPRPLPNFDGRIVFGGSLAGMIWFDREWNPTSFAFETIRRPLKETLAYVFKNY